MPHHKHGNQKIYKVWVMLTEVVSTYSKSRKPAQWNFAQEKRSNNNFPPPEGYVAVEEWMLLIGRRMGKVSWNANLPSTVGGRVSTYKYRFL